MYENPHQFPRTCLEVSFIRCDALLSLLDAWGCSLRRPRTRHGPVELKPNQKPPIWFQPHISWDIADGLLLGAAGQSWISMGKPTQTWKTLKNLMVSLTQCGCLKNQCQGPASALPSALLTRAVNSSMSVLAVLICQQTLLPSAAMTLQVLQR